MTLSGGSGGDLGAPSDDPFKMAHLAIDRLDTGLMAEKTALAQGQHLLREAWKTYFLRSEGARKENETTRLQVAQALVDAGGP